MSTRDTDEQRRARAERRQDEFSARLLGLTGKAERVFTPDAIFCAFMEAAVNYALRTNSPGEVVELLRQAADDLEQGEPLRSVQ